MYCLNAVDKERQEHKVGPRGLAGCQQVYTCICSKAPVIVFARAVYTGKWFLMQQCLQLVAFRNLGHHVHQERIVVYCYVALFKYWCALKLRWSYFVMPCAQWYAQFV